MVPQQQGNRMLAHGIDRLENCMELLEESNGNKRPGQASKDSLVSRASFLAGSFFQSWLIMIEQIEHCSSESRSFSDVLCRRNVMTKWPQPFLLRKQLTCCWTNRRHLRCGETDTSSLTKYVGHTSRFHHSRSFGTRSTSLQKLSKKTRRDCPMRDTVRLQNALKEHTPTMLLRLCWRIRLSKHKHWERRLATMFLKARLIHCLKLLLDIVFWESRPFKSRVR